MRLDLEEGEVRELHLVRIGEEVVLVQREGELLQGLVVVAWNQEILISERLVAFISDPPAPQVGSTSLQESSRKTAFQA